MFLFLVTAICSFVALGNNLLYKCKGIMSPSLPVSTLYNTFIETWLDDVFRFTVITDHLLLKIIELYSPCQYDLLLHPVDVLPILGHGQFYFISPTSADLSEVVDLATLHTLLPIGKAFSGWMARTTITATLICGHFGTCLWFAQIASLSPFYCLYLVKHLCFTKTGYYCRLGSLVFPFLSPN